MFIFYILSREIHNPFPSTTHPPTKPSTSPTKIYNNKSTGMHNPCLAPLTVKVHKKIRSNANQPNEQSLQIGVVTKCYDLMAVVHEEANGLQ